MLIQGTVSNIQTPSDPAPPAPTAGFQDGFESGSFGAWTGITATAGETIGIVSTVEHSGTYSAKLTSNGGSSFEDAYCYENMASSQELYGRSFVYVSESGISANDDRFYFEILQANANSVAYAGWRMVGGVVKWNLLIRDGTGWAAAYSSSIPSLNQWYSVELYWKADSSNGMGELFINGQLVCSISNKNTSYYGSVTSANFGLPELYNCASTQIYLDDCAISGAYI